MNIKSALDTKYISKDDYVVTLQFVNESINRMQLTIVWFITFYTYEWYQLGGTFSWINNK